MTNYYLGGVTGSETFTYTVAEELRARGHDVQLACWMFTPGKGGAFEYESLHCAERVWASWFKPDVIHAHHNKCAVRARELWPDVPMVYVSHSAQEPLEQMPKDCGIAFGFAVSPEVRAEMVCQGPLALEQTAWIGQPVNVCRFRPRAPVNPTIRRILVVSARLPQRRKRIIEEAAHYLRAGLRFAGGDGNWHSQGALAQLYNWADVVFSMGRGVYEAMCCARVPVVFDKWGGDGMVTPKNAGGLAWYNFSGRKFHRDWTLPELLTVLGKYDAENGRALFDWARPECDVRLVCDELLTAYEGVIKDGDSYRRSGAADEPGHRGTCTGSG